MRNINKLSPRAYLFLTVVGSFIAMIVYRATIFCCLTFNTYKESITKLWLIWGACLVVTYLMTFRRRRNYFSIFANAVLPFGIYTGLTYDYSQPLILLIVQLAIFMLGGLFGIANIIAFKIPDEPGKLRKMLKIRLLHFLNGVRSIAAVCLSALIIYVSGLYAFDSPPIIPAVKPSVSLEADKAEAVEKNLPAISKIEKSVWKTLSLEDRLDTMQTLANVEKTHLGISHEINVRADSLGLGTYGTYDHPKHEVTINTQVLMDDDPSDATVTLCHELRHAYQHDSADAFLSLDKEYQQLAVFDDMRDFYENFEDYQNATLDGFEEYENQKVESDSREYSEQRAAFYFWAVDKYYLKNE